MEILIKIKNAPKDDNKRMIFRSTETCKKYVLIFRMAAVLGHFVRAMFSWVETLAQFNRD